MRGLVESLGMGGDWMRKLLIAVLAALHLTVDKFRAVARHFHADGVWKMMCVENDEGDAPGLSKIGRMAW